MATVGVTSTDHDDGPLVQRWIVAAQRAGRTVVELPPGVYRLRAPLIIPPGMTLRGAQSTDGDPEEAD